MSSLWTSAGASVPAFRWVSTSLMAATSPSNDASWRARISDWGPISTYTGSTEPSASARADSVSELDTNDTDAGATMSAVATSPTCRAVALGTRSTTKIANRVTPTSAVTATRRATAAPFMARSRGARVLVMNMWSGDATPENPRITVGEPGH